MPYNVICLACTVVALAFGPLHNITTKNLTIEEGEMEKGFLGKLIAKVKGLFGRREQAETATEEPEEKEEEKSSD